MAGQVYAGAVAPEEMSIDISRGRTSLDLTDVSSVRALVTRPDQTQVTWEWGTDAFSAQTASRILVTREFASDGSDVPQAGLYQVKVSLVFSGGGVRRLPPSTFTVSPY